MDILIKSSAKVKYHKSNLQLYIEGTYHFYQSVTSETQHATILGPLQHSIHITNAKITKHKKHKTGKTHLQHNHQQYGQETVIHLTEAECLKNDLDVEI